MVKHAQKYMKDKEISDSITQTKVSHGRIETVMRVRNAKTKKELDMELKRLKILKELDNSIIGKEFNFPSSIKHWQQLILIIGKLQLKSTNEILLACKKLNYAGKLDKQRIKFFLVFSKKEYFNYDKEKGWNLTNKGQNEFSRLNQFI